MPSPPELARLGPRRGYLVLLGLIWVVMVALVVVFRGVLLPFAGALLVAYVIAPLVSRISAIPIGRFHMPRWGSILLLYAGLFTILWVFAVSALPQLYREVARVLFELRDLMGRLTPEQISEWVRSGERWLELRGIPVDLGNPAAVTGGSHEVGGDASALVTGSHTASSGARITLDLAGAIQQMLDSVSSSFSTRLLDLVGYSRTLVAGVGQFLFVFFFTLMVAAFVLIDPGSIIGAFRRIVPTGWRDDYDGLLVRIDEKLAGVVRGQIIICLVNGVLTLIGLLLLDVKFALLLASIATVLSFIPIFGSIVSTIPIVAVGLTQSWQTGLLALAWIVFIHALEAYFLNPKIMGTAAKIHPALIAMALLVGERSWGLVGALFAVPVLSILLAAFNHLRARAQDLEDAASAEVVELAPRSTETGSGPRSA